MRISVQLQQAVKRRGLTLYGLAQLIGAETDEPLKTIHQRLIGYTVNTQAENFFAFHMGNSDDIGALVKSNINYDGVISNFIQRETIAGNLYMVSSDQAFALPVRVNEFEKLVEEKVYPEAKLRD